MSLHYQGIPNRQLIDQTITFYGLDVQPVDSSDLTTEPKVTNDVRRVIMGRALPGKPEKLIAIKSSDTFGYSAVLRSGSQYSGYLKNINYTESARTNRTASAIRAGKFNLYTGKFAPAYPVVSNDAFGNDNAARSSYNTPGSFTFRVGNNITSKNYEAKG